MKILICCRSYHHGNTKKVVEAMAGEGNVDLVDVSAHGTVSMEDYDCIGLASGIYGFSVHQDLVELARQLPQGKPCSSSTPTASNPAPGPKPSTRSPKRRDARYWGSSPAGASTPSAPSSWREGPPRAIPMNKIWTRQGPFSGGCWNGWRGEGRFSFSHVDIIL